MEDSQQDSYDSQAGVGATLRDSEALDPQLRGQRSSADVRVTILMWHKVDDAAPTQYWVTAAQFARQMAALKAYGYTPIALRTLCAHVDGRETTLPAKPVVLSFDDGYQNLYTRAFPILRQYAFPSVAFIPTGKIGTTDRQDNDWDTHEASFKCSHLLWSEIEAMAATGLIDFQSHTVTHADLEAPDVDIEWELSQSKQDLAAHVPNAVDSLSYPWGLGADSEAVRQQVRQAGYKAAVAAWGEIEPLADANVWSLKRVEVATWHDVVYDGDPAHFFMRLLDATFPIPHITVSSIIFLDPATREERTEIRPGDSVLIRMTAKNTGAAAPVKVLLAIRNDVEPSMPASERDGKWPAGQVEYLFAADSDASFEFAWSAPEYAHEGLCHLRLSFRDEYDVLGWLDTEWHVDLKSPRGSRSTEDAPARAYYD